MTGVPVHKLAFNEFHNQVGRSDSSMPIIKLKL
jgi:hypothetical protein